MFYDKSVINKVCAISIVEYLGSLGIATAKYFGEQHKGTVQNRSNLYHNYKDFNELLMR